jgi:branched-chain amino acid transport system substrate-binding protein
VDDRLGAELRHRVAGLCQIHPRRDYLHGVQNILKDRYDLQMTSASYEVTDATIDSQLVSLQSAGIDVLMTVAGPKFAAQSIRRG